MSHTIPLSRYREMLTAYLAPQWRAVLILAVVLFGSIGVQLVTPQLLRAIIDTSLENGPTDRLMNAALLFLAATLAGQALGVAIGWVSGEVGWRATNRLRADLLRHSLRLDLPFHHANPPGALIERIDGDVSALNEFFSAFVLRLFGSAVLLVGVLVVLLFEEWRVGLALTVFSVVALLTLARIRNVGVGPNRAEREASADLYGFLEERLGGIEDLRANGGGGWALNRFAPLLRTNYLRGRRADLASGVVSGTGIALFAVGTALALGLGAAFYQAGAMTIGTVFLIFRYTQLLERPLEQITRQLENLQRASAGLLRAQELLATAPKVADGPGAPLPDGPLGVAFEGVSFAYADADPDERALRDLTFDLAPGRTLGLLGRTGSGKTTLARLLLRLYDPTAGAIRLGGVDLRNARLDELRGRIGIVTQDVRLFGATLRDNLTLFDPAIDDVRLIGALHDLGLGAWYDGLPAGLDTPLSAEGGLSAGEAQLLAFARVFLRDPGLVILDEASSRLDPATERLIERAVGRLLAGRTAIVIAHRLATVARVDEILILDEGRIAERDERERLAGDPASRFARLLRVGLNERGTGSAERGTRDENDATGDTAPFSVPRSALGEVLA